MLFGLKDYQLDAIECMHNGCVLKGKTGSGKSRTALGYYYKENGGELIDDSMYHKMKNPLDLYIITTALKRDSKEWEIELALFDVTNSEDKIYNNLVTVDSWNNINRYKNIANAFFIFDEQRAVGRGTWAKTFIKIAKNNDWIMLSATPGDAWKDYGALFIANGFYSGFTEFEHSHFIYHPYREHFIVGYFNESRLERQRDAILVDMDYRRQVNSNDIYINCSYNKEFYGHILKNWNPWEDKPIKNLTSKMYFLRKCVNADDDRQVKLLEVYEKHPKLIIFYNFDYELDILKNLCYGPDVIVAEWNGHIHQPVPDEASKWVYLVQYTAGAEGWNCISTDTILFYSQNYSYKIMEQAAGRIARLNTPFNELFYYHLISKSSIDRGIKHAIDAKHIFTEGGFAKLSRNN